MSPSSASPSSSSPSRWIVGRVCLTALAGCLTLGLLPQALTAQASPNLSDYLPSGTEYDAKVPMPENVLGWQVGTWHVRHDQLLSYMRAVASSSPRVRLEVIGHTHERRELVQLVISSPENLERLDDILEANRRLGDPNASAIDIDNLPIVVNMGYSVHGNEASGSNASLLVTYFLAAAHGDEIQRWLNDAVIVVDPSLNPDGLSRFAQWVNMHRGKRLVADPNHREHQEAWPSGRTNHYWFDLNRDWLLAQHPESQARLARFHQFQPAVLTDFHEMGTNSTYFFQPGVPSRKNPLTPERNVELTQGFAEYHARVLDEIGSLYYSEESFDDFYYGKGSTYPDIHGAIGILFEQASSRGHLQESTNGLLSFPFAIRNQVRTSFSTLRAAVSKRKELLKYRRDFFRGSLELAEENGYGAWVFGDADDDARTFHMVEILRRHDIDVHALAKDLTVGAFDFQAGSAWIVPVDQRQYRLLRTLFEQPVTFEDTTFYDVSAWTLPLAFDMPYAGVPRRSDLTSFLGERLEDPSFPEGTVPAVATNAPSPYAYVFPWNDFYAPRALGRLLQHGVKARVAMRPLRLDTRGGSPQDFERGTIIVPRQQRGMEGERLQSLLSQAARLDGITVHAVDTGLALQGIDLGSPNIRPLETPRIALLVGRGVDTYAAGEIWHLLDHRFGLVTSLVDTADLHRTRLERYSHLILVDGNYDRLSLSFAADVDRWVDEGGTLITIRRGASWAERHVLAPRPKGKGSTTSGQPGAAGGKASSDDKLERRPFEESEPQRAKQLISGTIFAADLDLTHPLAYGYGDRQLAMFRNHRVHLKPSKNSYATVAQYLSSPLLAGYVSDENLEKLRQAPAVIAEDHGRGVVVRIADDPNFRAYWYGTNRLLLNAVFFGPTLSTEGRRRD